MKKLKPFFFLILAFLFTFLYLQQKVGIQVQAYQLSENYRFYNELVDKRDFMMYNFTRKISLAQVNQWAENNDLSTVNRSRLVALNLKQEKVPVLENELAAMFHRFIGGSTVASTAFAGDKKQ